LTAVRFVDTTLRDGHACLWAEGMRTGMMLAVAEELDRAGFAAVEVIATSHFKKCVRELREDPWERLRLLAARMRATPLAAMGGSNPRTFGVAPLSVVGLYLQRLAAAGIRRVQLMEASNDMANRVEPAVRMAHAAGLQVVVALVFSLSPRHTDAYYARKAHDAVAVGADIVYLKDSGGLLTPERVRTVVPAVRSGLGGTPLEFHTHCTTGLGPLCTLAALVAGVTTVHTAVPPLADGASQPSVFNVARNARALGFDPQVDEAPLRVVRERLEAIARTEGLPEGCPVEYDAAQYVHPVPGDQ
jgi:oxaloacetate decarboxylase alpha subunit